MIKSVLQKLQGKPLEQISLSAVYAEILSKVYILGIAFTVAYFQSVYIEWGLKNPVNLILSAAELFIAITILFISFFYKKIFFYAPVLIRVLFFLLVLIEIETGFHDPLIPFFDPKNWLTIIALVWVCSFFYPGNVWQFVTEWSVILFYYFVRVYFENNYQIPSETWRESTTIIPLFIVCFFLNHWWFKTRYVAAYRGILLDEQKKSLFQDMHDSLGSNLTDISLLAKKFESHPHEITSDQLSKLKLLSEDALRALRSQLHEEDQKEILRVSFLDGLRLILKKRYKNVGRNVNFEWDPKWNETSIRLLDKEAIHNLFMIFSEITTNDLKFSKGVSTWKLSIEPQVFWFHFSSGQQDSLGKEKQEVEWGEGMGETSMRSRAELLGGSLSITKNPYSIQLIIPTNLFEW